MSQVVFSLFFLVWNLLVAVVLVSVARTQVTHQQTVIVLSCAVCGHLRLT